MAGLQGTVQAPIIRLIAQEILSLIQNDYELRKIQGRNAQQACYFDAQSITGATKYQITEANSGNEIFTTLVVTLDATSGSGRYRVDINNTVAPGLTGGHNIPAGGGIITITGHNNIKNFTMIADAGQTLIFARNLYK